MLTVGDVLAVDGFCLDDLFVMLKRNVAEHHVKQQNAEGPDSCWDGEVSARCYPLRWTVDPRAYIQSYSSTGDCVGQLLEWQGIGEMLSNPVDRRPACLHTIIQ